MKAFPSTHDPKTGTMQLGMELRDYFAAAAMQSVMPEILKELRSRPVSDEDTNKLKTVASEACYSLADAMMKARDA